MVGGMITCVFPILCHYQHFAKEKDNLPTFQKMVDVVVLMLVIIIMFVTSWLSLSGRVHKENDDHID